MSGSTNSKIEQQNKQVKKQYQYDKEWWKYNRDEDKRKYEKAVEDTALKQQQYDDQAAYKDAINVQQYNYQQELRRYEYQNERDAYNQSLKDYDYQTELNSLSGAMAQEAEDRKIDEALISRNFGNTDADIAEDKARSDMEFGVATENRKIEYGEKNLKVDKADNAAERKFLTTDNEYNLSINSDRDKQLDNDIKYIADKEGWDNTRVDYTFNKAQAANFNDRIRQMVNKELKVGQARAAGREGLSAEREVTNALAEYGRNTAELVDSMVFAKKDRDLDKTVIKGTAKYQTDQKKLDKSILGTERKKISLLYDRNIERSKYKDSKLDLAFNELKDQSLANIDKLKADFGFTQRSINQDRKKLQTTFDSAKLQYQANSEKIKFDENVANHAAWGQVRMKPQVPPKLPKPLETPRVTLPLPLEPTKPPKPIKGTLGKTSIWNDIGDGLNFGLQIAGLFI